MPDLSKINELIEKINKILAEIQRIQNSFISALNKIIDDIEDALRNAGNHADEWLQEKLDVLNEKIERILEKFNKKIEGFIETLKQWYEKLAFFVKKSAVAMVSAMFGLNLDNESKEIAANALPTPELPIPEIKIEMPELSYDIDLEVSLPRIPMVEIPQLGTSDINFGDSIKEAYKTTVLDTEEVYDEDINAAFESIINKSIYEDASYASEMVLANAISNNASTTSDITYSSGEKNGKYVILDNGHGKNQGGKRSPVDKDGEFGEKGKIPFYEWKWNRTIVKKLKQKLEEKGYTVHVICEKDDVPGYSTLRTYVKDYYNKNKNVIKDDNCLFISVHGNAAGNGSKWMSGKGWSVFTYAPENKDPNAKIKFDPALRNSAYKTYFEKSDNLAKIFSDTAKEMGLKAHGNNYKIRHKWFSVLSANSTIYNKIPSILTENFFYDNKEDLKFMLSEEGQNKIVDLHVRGIDNYFFGNKA